MVRFVLNSACILLMGAAVSCSSSSSKNSTAVFKRAVVLQAALGTLSCNSNSDCVSGFVCDLTFPTGGKSGTCEPVCNSASGCASGAICNPVIGACEPKCTITSAGPPQVDTCGSLFAAAGSTCSSAGYCLKLCPNGVSDCSGLSGYTCARGICAPKCTINADCPAPGQVCNLTTKTCEFSCNLGAAVNPCESIYPGTACSPISATCVQACPTTPATACRGSARACYVPAKANPQTGTCETTCDNLVGDPCPTSSSLSASNNGTCSALDIVVNGQAATQKICQLVCGTGSGQAACPTGIICSSTSAGVCQVNLCTEVTDCPNITDFACLNRQCVIKCGTTASPCVSPQQCVNNQCTTPSCPCGLGFRCNLASSTCVPQTCSGGNVCDSGFGCAAGTCIPNQCGDGIVGTGEFCDEGHQIQGLCAVDTDCPYNWTCSQTSKKCVPQFPGAGNGQNGHCSQDCKTICAVSVTYANSPVPTWSSEPNPKLPTATTITAALSALSVANSAAPTSEKCPDGVLGTQYTSATSTSTQLSQCPCGYGIWVGNGAGSSPESYPVTIKNPIALYGGFGPGIKSLQGRVDSRTPGQPLGQTSFSGTILSPSDAPNVFNLSVPAGPSTIRVVIDGFQILNAKQSGVIIGPNVTADLRNLRIFGNGNENTDSGGGIRNQGVMYLKDSVVSLNKSATQGGGISHEPQGAGPGSTVERVTFFGNGFKSSKVTSLWPTCTAGYSGPKGLPTGGASPSPTSGNDVICPSGMICPPAGGYCTQPTCTATIPCPSGWSCPGTGGTCLPISDSANNCLLGYKPPSAANTVCIVPTNPTSDNPCPAYWTLTTGGTATSPTKSCGTAPAPTPASQSGGAIAATGSTALTIAASKFNANYAYGNGGAIYANSPVNVLGSLFTANWASNAGGGIYLTNSGTGKLYGLTLVDNAAYGQGGGGIFDSGGGSTLSSGLFRNNTGLYPLNNNNLAEFVGNRGNSTFYSQINSLSSGLPLLTTSATVIKSPDNVDTLKFIDMCPIIAYTYTDGICDGSRLCGTPDANLPRTGKISFDQRTKPNTNECLTSEFSDCTNPTYKTCSPASNDKAISDVTDGPPVEDFGGVNISDFAGNSYRGTNMWRGAYQAPCVINSDCSKSFPACRSGNCVVQ